MEIKIYKFDYEYRNWLVLKECLLIIKFVEFVFMGVIFKFDNVGFE